MNDIEERLRSGLHQLAEPVDARVDTGGIALATLVGVLAWNGLSGRQVVAIPDPISSTAPAPGAPSVMLSFPQSDPPQTWTGVTLSVVRTGERFTIEVSRIHPNGEAGARHTYTAPAGQFWSVPVDDDLVVALLPNPVISVASLPGWDVSVNDAVDVGMTAVGVQRSDAAAGPYGGLVWRGADFEVHDSEGGVVPSAVLSAGDRGLLVFRDEELGVWGYLDAYNDDNSARPITTEPVSTVYEMAKNADGEVTEIGFLPVGGRNPKVTTRAGATWGSAVIGDSGRVAYIVFAVRPANTPLVTSVTYTDSTGARVTYNS